MAVPTKLTINLGTEAQAEATIKLACESRGRIPATPPTAEDQAFAHAVAVEAFQGFLNAAKVRLETERSQPVAGLS